MWRQVWSLLWVTAFCAILPTHTNAVCNFDGQPDLSEECDDGNTLNNDGCTACILDSVQLDFDSSDTTGTLYSIEFFDIDVPVFFADPSLLRFSVTPSTLNLTRIFLVMLGDDPPVTDTIDVETAAAFSQGRTFGIDFTGFFDRSPLRPLDPRLNNLNTFIDTSLVTAGMVVSGDTDSIFFPGGDGDDLLSATEAEAVLLSAAYTANIHPGFNPRQFCAILTDDVNATTTTCLTLRFIGRNDESPVITYESEGVASFTEGQMNFVPIINGNITITDPDHPRYLQMSAQARITGFTAGYPEYLGITSEHPEFTYSYNDSTGTLSISGEGTPELYATLLSNLTYLNNMSEPIGSSRQIELTVYDGMFRSPPAIVTVSITNTNDAPIVSLNGEDPVITSLSLNFVEGSGTLFIAPNLVVVDVDPDPIIRRLTVRLTNPQDPGFERLGLGTTVVLGISLRMNDFMIEFTGDFSSSTYTNVVSRVTYQHLSAIPSANGNPTTEVIRVIAYEVEDSNGVISVMNSTVLVTIIPVNDPPFLFFVTSDDFRSFPIPVPNGLSMLTFQYTEDDVPLNFGQSIYLRDFDSNISMAILVLDNLLNGAQDVVSVNSDLLVAPITMTSEDRNEGRTRVIRLTGEASYDAYEQILRSLTYINTHGTNQVVDGTRTITITVNDTEPLTSGEITARIDVGDRNDAPAVNLGAGEGMNLNITFVENGPSIPIVLPHLVSIMDEENHNISRLTAELVATNGQLDLGDAIFLRSPRALQFIDDFRNPPTTSLLDIALNATTATFTDALLSIYYDNGEAEPTLYVNNSLLNREILITVYDNNFLQEGQSNELDSNFDDDFGVGRTMLRVLIKIYPINDNQPRIVIRAEPDGCGVSSTAAGNVEGVARRRRDVRAAGARMKRAVRSDSSKAPEVASVHATFSSNCLDTVTISFTSNTSTPVVEVPAKLDAMLSFDTPELQSTLKFGVWFDSKTLVVVFGECVIPNEKERPVYVMFEAERGDCDWATTCSDDTICFNNNTGCPVYGSYRVKTNTPCPVGERCVEIPGQDEEAAEEDGSFYNTITIVLVMLTLLVILLAFFFSSRNRLNQRSRNHTPPSGLKPTIIDMTTPSQEKVIPLDEVRPQGIIVTPPTPPPQYESKREEEIISSNYEKSTSKSEDTRKRRKKTRRKKKQVPQEEEDEEFLLTQHSEEEEPAVATLLLLQRSHDQPCDSTAPTSGTQSRSVGVADGIASQTNQTSRELLLNSGGSHSTEERGVASSQTQYT